MKRFYIALIAIAMTGLTAMAQNLVVNGGFETWTNSTTPESWTVFENTSQETTIKHSGANSAKMSATATKKLYQTVPVTAGHTYQIDFYYLDNDANGKFRIWSAFRDDAAAVGDNTAFQPSTYSTDDANWGHFTATAVAPTGATNFRFEVRFYSDGAGGGSIYFDDFSLVDVTPSDPALTVASPSQNQYFDANNVSVEFSTLNFDVATAGNGDGHIRYQLDGGAWTDVFTTDPIALTGLADGSHQLITKLVTDANADLSTPVSVTTNFNVAPHAMNLNPGELAIIQYESDAPDGFTMVALSNIPANSYINFTDKGWQNASSGVDTFYTTEDHLMWLTPASGVAKGTVISYQDGIGFSTGGAIGFLNGISASGDQIFIFNGTLTTPDFVFGINNRGSWIDASMYPDSAISSNTSFLPDGLTNGVNAIAFNDKENGYYEITPLVVADMNAALASICDTANWNMSDAIIWQPNTYWSFTVSVPEINAQAQGLYPNPAQESISVLNAAVTEIRIFDLNGKMVKSVSHVQNQINISELKAGVYMVQMIEPTQTTVSKLIKL